MHLGYMLAYAITVIATNGFFLSIGFYFEACAHQFHSMFEDMNKLARSGMELKAATIQAISFQIANRKYDVQ